MIALPRTRWIVIGHLRRGFVVFNGIWGVPAAWTIAWRGRPIWCAPCEFLKVPHVESAVRIRLAIAGLELVETDWIRGEGLEMIVRCRVKRRPRPVRPTAETEP